MSKNPTKKIPQVGKRATFAGENAAINAALDEARREAKPHSLRRALGENKTPSAAGNNIKMAFFDFFRPKWKHSNTQIRINCVQQLKNEMLLEQIALKDSSGDVRKLAVQKLTNETVLEQIALKDSSDGVRKLAVQKLTNETVLEQIALKDSNSDVFIEAIKKIVDKKKSSKLASMRVQDLKKTLVDCKTNLSSTPMTIEEYVGEQWVSTGKFFDGAPDEIVAITKFVDNPQYDRLLRIVHELERYIETIEEYINHLQLYEH